MRKVRSISPTAMAIKLTARWAFSHRVESWRTEAHKARVLATIAVRTISRRI